MNDINTTSSDMDIYECNSWTVLCECEASNKPESEKCKDCHVRNYDVFPDLVIIDNKELLDDKESKHDGENVVSGDQNSASENFNEMIQENECAEKCSEQKSHSKCKCRRKRRGKSKVNEIGSLFIIGTVLALTGASFLCILTPKNVNLGPSSLSQFQANCSKLGIVKDVSPSQLPIKAIINKYGSKISIQDKDGAFQSCLTNQSSISNNTNSKELVNFIGPLTYEQFQSKVEAFNKQYEKPSSSNQVETEKQAKKQSPLPVACTVKTSKMGEKSVRLAKTTRKAPAASVPTPSKAETRKENQSCSQCYSLCNVLQDLALLRLTQVVSKQLAEKAAKRKKEVALTSEVRKKPVLKRQGSLLKTKKRSTSITALTLWEELPFNHDVVGLNSTMTAISEEEEDVQEVGSRVSSTDVLNTPIKQQILKKRRKRQLDYLEKLKQEHSDRMTQLKGIRERQQQSIQALIQERKQDFKKINIYAEQQQHIMEGKRRILEINDYYKKLKSGIISKSTSDFSHKAITNGRPSPPLCRNTDSIYSLSNINNNRNNMLNSIPASKKTIEENEKLSNVNSSQYLNMRKKYYEQISNYWTKRDEYLNERINFMKDVSGSLKEVMGKFRNDVNDSQKSKEALVGIINEASLVFPDCENLEKLKSKVQKADTSLDGSSKDSNNNNCTMQLNRYCSLRNFDQNRQCIFSASSSDTVKDESFYCHLFGKKANRIRRRDLAVCHYNGFPKIVQNEFSQHEIRRNHLGRKSKKEIKQPDLNRT